MSSGRDHGTCGRADSCTYGNGDNTTELHFAADGRVYLFGASAEVLDAILASGIEEDALPRRMLVVQLHNTTSGVANVGSIDR